MGRGSKRKVEKQQLDESIDSESETQNEDSTTLLHPRSKKGRKVARDAELCLVGPSIAADEARRRWPLRYQSKVRYIKMKIILFLFPFIAQFCPDYLFIFGFSGLQNKVKKQAVTETSNE